MNNKILTKAKNILAEKRLKAETLADNQRKALASNKEFARLHADYTSCMIENAKDGKKQAELNAKKEAYEAWLKKNNVNLSPLYSCQKCGDTGYIDGQMCSCLKKEVTRILLEESGFGELEEFSKSDFSKFEKPDEMKKLYSLMEEWCNQTKHKKTLIFFSGGTGVGKTHLTKCMANELIEHGHLVNLTTAFNMNQDLTKAFQTFDSTIQDQTLQKYLDCEYLFIDDLGTEIVNKLAVKMLYLILNERRMRGLSTIITSNLDLKDIRDQYDERIASRIIDKSTSICVRLDGKDLRLQTKK